MSNTGKLRIDKTGMQFGKLTVIKLFGRIKGGNAVWACQCECGKGVQCRSDLLKRQSRIGCGCGRAYKKKHGDSFEPEYKLLNNILSRCYNPKTLKYHLYGGRGIGVAEEWRGMDKYPAFLAHVGRRPSPKHSLDRWPNKNGNYEPGNVRWATSTEQMRNARSNVMVTVNGEMACVTEMSAKYGIRKNTAISRIKRGWSARDTFTTPPGQAPLKLLEPENSGGQACAIRPVENHEH